MRVCLGGTFDPLHRGHKKLIDKALELSDNVVIGLTSNELATTLRHTNVRAYEERKKDLLSHLAGKKRVRIVKLKDRYGPALRERFNRIIVSPETEPVAHAINNRREKLGEKRINICRIPWVLAQDGLPISSTRIKEGKINVEGELQSVRVAIGSANTIKTDATKEVFAKVFKNSLVRGFESKKKIERSTREIIRCAKSVVARGNYDFGVSVELLSQQEKQTKKYFIAYYCALVDRGGRIALGHSAGFTCLSEKVKDVSVENLSKDVMSDKELIKQAIQTALLQRLKKEIYQQNF